MHSDKVLDFLSRPDKWYLGGGNRPLWDPPFPFLTNHPDLWDKADYYNHEVRRFYTWTILDDTGKKAPLDFTKKVWNPVNITQEYAGQSYKGSIADLRDPETFHN